MQLQWIVNICCRIGFLVPANQYSTWNLSLFDETNKTNAIGLGRKRTTMRFDGLGVTRLVNIILFYLLRMQDAFRRKPYHTLANCVTKTVWPPFSFDQRIIPNVEVNSSRAYLIFVYAWWSPQWPRCKFGDRGPYCIPYVHDRSRSRSHPTVGEAGEIATDSRYRPTAIFSIVAVGPGKRRFFVI